MTARRDEAVLQGVLKLAALAAGNAARSGEALTVALIELGELAAIGARHGPAVADEVRHHALVQVVAALRGEDAVVPAGDQLVALLPGASFATAGVALERVHRRLAAEPFVLAGDTPLPLAVTIGAAASGGRGASGADVLTAARDALVRARTSSTSSPCVVYAEAATGDLPTIDPFEPLLEATFAESYRLLQPISKGAVGVVYRAEDLGLARPVAIKLLHHELARNPAWVARFRQEAAILAALRHPHIVQAHACGEWNGTHYLVMELIEGSSVKDLLERAAREARPLALEVGARIVAQIASALDALHAAGVVHRDVKPANILMDPFRERAVLVDVGIAQRRGADRQAAGTLGYMAPEVLAHGRYDARADVFGLAATAFEMLTGRAPWPASRTPFELLARLEHEPPPRPSDLDARLAPFDALLDAALAIDPERRLARAGELGARFAVAAGEVKASTRTRTARASSGDAPPTSAVSRAALLRTLASVVSAGELEALRAAAAADDDRELADALAPLSPLAWLPSTAVLAALRRLRPGDDDRRALAHALGRATIRSTFRRLFPASGATLAPGGTLAALPSIWRQYHGWGAVATMVDGAGRGFVTITGTLGDPVMCAVTDGMLEQLLLLSGGDNTRSRHLACEAQGDAACEHEVHWDLRRPDDADAVAPRR